eukprot:gene11380-biopygen4849
MLGWVEFFEFPLSWFICQQILHRRGRSGGRWKELSPFSSKRRFCAGHQVVGSEKRRSLPPPALPAPPVAAPPPPPPFTSTSHKLAFTAAHTHKEEGGQARSVLSALRAVSCGGFGRPEGSEEALPHPLELPPPRGKAAPLMYRHPGGTSLLATATRTIPP